MYNRYNEKVAMMHSPINYSQLLCDNHLVTCKESIKEAFENIYDLDYEDDKSCILKSIKECAASASRGEKAGEKQDDSQ